MSQELKTRSHTEIMEEFGRISILAKEGERYQIIFGVCASFYKWVFCQTETKVSEIMDKIKGKDQYWSREIGQS